MTKRPARRRGHPPKWFRRRRGAALQTEINQRDALLARIQSRGYDQVMEETAYTWFNRFIALRYMQEHNLLPVSVRVLPDAPGALPELVRQAQNVELDGVDFSHVVELLEGNRTETLYTELLIALCNQLSDVLPQMFEPISDYTELLFPDGLLREDSVLAMLAAVDAENWADIQVIGWLYQYYNTELKNETLELLKKNAQDHQGAHRRGDPAFHARMDRSLHGGKQPWPSLAGRTRRPCASPALALLHG